MVLTLSRYGVRIGLATLAVLTVLLTTLALPRTAAAVLVTPRADRGFQMVLGGSLSAGVGRIYFVEGRTIRWRDMGTGAYGTFGRLRRDQYVQAIDSDAGTVAILVSRYTSYSRRSRRYAGKQYLYVNRAPDSGGPTETGAFYGVLEKRTCGSYINSIAVNADGSVSVARADTGRVRGLCERGGRSANERFLRIDASSGTPVTQNLFKMPVPRRARRSLVRYGSYASMSVFAGKALISGAFGHTRYVDLATGASRSLGGYRDSRWSYGEINKYGSLNLVSVFRSNMGFSVWNPADDERSALEPFPRGSWHGMDSCGRYVIHCRLSRGSVKTTIFDLVDQTRASLPTISWKNIYQVGCSDDYAFISRIRSDRFVDVTVFSITAQTPEP